MNDQRTPAEHPSEPKPVGTTGDWPSRRAGLRDDIARTIHRYDRDHLLSRSDIPSKHHRGEADAVLTLLYREWPWLQAGAEELERARAELQQHAEAESADAAAGSYAGRAERVEAQLAAVADLIADHEGDEWAAHPATSTLRGILDGDEPAATRTALAEYENAINWHTDCLSCARVLDSSIRELERAEKAEAALREVLDLLLPVHAGGEVIGYEPPLPIQAGAVDRWRAVLSPVPTGTDAAPPAPRDPCPYCEASSDRIPRAELGQHIAEQHPEVKGAGA